MKQKMNFIFISLIVIAGSCEKNVPVSNTSQSCNDNLIISDSLYTNALLPDSCFDTSSQSWYHLNHYFYDLFHLSFNASAGQFDTLENIYFTNDCINIPVSSGIRSFYLIWDGKPIINNSHIEVNVLLFAEENCGGSLTLLVSGYYSWDLSLLKQQIKNKFPDINSVKIIINPHLNNENKKECYYSF